MSLLSLLGGKLVLVQGQFEKKTGLIFGWKIRVFWASPGTVLGAVCSGKNENLGMDLGS